MKKSLKKRINNRRNIAFSFPLIVGIFLSSTVVSAEEVEITHSFSLEHKEMLQGALKVQNSDFVPISEWNPKADSNNYLYYRAANKEKEETEKEELRNYSFNALKEYPSDYKQASNIARKIIESTVSSSSAVPPTVNIVENKIIMTWAIKIKTVMVEISPKGNLSILFIYPEKEDIDFVSGKLSETSKINQLVNQLKEINEAAAKKDNWRDMFKI